jgi:hypothetical protein
MRWPYDRETQHRLRPRPRVERSVVPPLHPNVSPRWLAFFVAPQYLADKVLRSHVALVAMADAAGVRIEVMSPAVIAESALADQGWRLAH